MSCPAFEDLASGAASTGHTSSCAICADALRDITAIRAEAGRLGPSAWGSPPPVVDVEAALGAVLRAVPGRPRRGGQLLRLTSRAAAALLIAGLGAPYLLETRKARQPMPLLTGMEGANSVFWTSPSGLLTARK